MVSPARTNRSADREAGDFGRDHAEMFILFESARLKLNPLWKRQIKFKIYYLFCLLSLSLSLFLSLSLSVDIFLSLSLSLYLNPPLSLCRTVLSLSLSPSYSPPPLSLSLSLSLCCAVLTFLSSSVSVPLWSGFTITHRVPSIEVSRTSNPRIRSSVSNQEEE